MGRRNQNSSALFSYLLFASVIVFLVTVLSGSAFSARAKSPKEAAALSSNALADPASVTTPQARPARPIAQLESELITITRRGFEPREINRPASRFLLMLENRSELAAISLQLKREDGEVIREVRLTREEPDWNAVLALSAGRYLLTEARHPRWVCRITITQS